MTSYAASTKADDNDVLPTPRRVVTMALCVSSATPNEGPRGVGGAGRAAGQGCEQPRPEPPSACGIFAGRPGPTVIARYWYENRTTGEWIPDEFQDFLQVAYLASPPYICIRIGGQAAFAGVAARESLFEKHLCPPHGWPERHQRLDGGQNDRPALLAGP